MTAARLPGRILGSTPLAQQKWRRYNREEDHRRTGDRRIVRRANGGQPDRGAGRYSGWSTYASLRSTDDFVTSADAGVYVRNPYSFRVLVKASPQQKVKVSWSYYCENGSRSQSYTVTAGNSSWVTKTLPRPSNPGDYCSVNIYVSLPNQDWDEVATVRAQLQAQTR